MIKNGWKYRVKYVKNVTTTNGNPITRFQVSEKVRNGVVYKYQNYGVTVWDHLELTDGDEVVLNNIRDIEASEYNEKLYIGFTADVLNVKEPEPEQPKSKERDTSTDLPWDI